VDYDYIPNDNVSKGLFPISKMQLKCVVAALDNISDTLVKMNFDLRKAGDMLSQCTAKLSSMKCGATT